MTPPQAGDTVTHAGARWRVESVAEVVTLVRVADRAGPGTAGDVRLVDAALID